MARKAENPVEGALAPFGRLGYRLGWRWVFPVGTLPMPYHPWLGAALPWATAIFFLMLGAYALIGRAPGLIWTTPLWAWLGLGLLLSVPFLQWFLFFLRVHVLQAAMAPMAMLLLAILAARGQMPVTAAALPALYFGTHLVLAIASRVALRRVLRENPAVEAGPPFADAPEIVRLIGSHSGDTARRRIKSLGTDTVEYAATVEGPAIRITQIAPDWMPDLAALVKALNDPDIRLLRPRDGDAALQSPAGIDARPVLFVRAARPSLLLSKELHGLDAWRAGEPVVRYRWGRALVFSWFPGFAGFFAMYLDGGGGGFRRVMGFLRTGMRGTMVGKVQSPDAAEALLFGTGPRAPADTTPLRRFLLRQAMERTEQARASLDLLLVGPEAWRRESLDILRLRPELYADRAEALCDAFTQAREAKAVLALHEIARLIAALPEDRFQAIGGRVIQLLNSIEVAISRPTSLRISKETFRKIKQGAPYPKMPFGGFGLLGATPGLYTRLGDLGLPARALIEGLGEKFDWPQALVEARTRAMRTGDSG